MMSFVMYVDNREPLEVVKSLELQNIEGKFNFEIKGKRLEIGDFITMDERSKVGNICIERKEMDDFVTSIMDGRIFEQAVEMKSAGFNVCVILISGNSLDITSKIKLHAIDGAKASLIAKYQCSVMTTLNTEQLIYTVLSIFKHCQYDVDPSKLHKQFKITKEQREMGMLSYIPGISRELAERLLIRHTIREIALIDDEKELMKIEGIGKIKAQNIINYFKG